MKGSDQDGEDKRARLARLLQEARRRQRAGDSPSAIRGATDARREDEDLPVVAAPATPAQQALWLLEELPGTGSAYAVALSACLEGPLHVDALRAALDALALRHDALRARFEAGDGPLRMHVDANARIGLEIVSLDAPPGDGSAPTAVDAGAWADARPDRYAEERAQALARAFVEVPFDLGSTPLARAQLVRLGPRRHRFTLAVHHIVCDGWSIGLIARDLGELYRARLETRAPALPAIGMAYARYAAWQCERTSDDRLAASIAHWRERLAGLEPLGLPTDRPRSARVDRTCGRVHWRIEPAATTALRALAGAEGATLYMVLLAAFQVLLARHAGSTDLAVGTPVAGRDRHETEATVGHFVNMLVMRTDLAGEPSFRELLVRVRDTAIDAFEHAQVPFDRLVAALAPAREPGVNPLFQVSFVLHNTAERPLRLAGLACESNRLRPGTTPFDLSLVVTERDEGLDAELEFATELFDRDRIERMAGHLQRLCAAIVETPDRPIGELAMLGREELRELALQGPVAAYPDRIHLSDMVAATAARTPDAVAVIHAGGELRYGELDAQANRLANRLRALGVVPNDCVGLCVERGPAMVAAMLAILRAGGAYLPLDPSHPAERRNTILADVRPRVVIADAALLAGLRLPAESRLLLPGIEAESISGESPLAPPQAGGADDLAYVLATSGSTGRPKAVMIPQRALVNHTAWLLGEFSIGPADRFLCRTTIAFDAAGVEIWPTLVAGGALVIADEDQSRDPAALLELVRAHDITLMQVVPGQLSLLCDVLQRDPAPLPLRTLFVGGDVLVPGDARRWHELAGTELVNLYGPTECTIDASYHRWTATADDRLPVPIGRPVANCTIRLLDPALRPVPQGARGEICIGGDVVGLGYLGQPELGAERFVVDPWSTRPGARLYRTGDLGRLRGDGQLEYIGRIDHQVKLRGFRIEPGEIEAALVAGGARQAVVLAVQDRLGTRRLAAYVEPADIDPGALRDTLSRRLPAYMQPSALVLLAALPRLANGKLDRHALPAPDFDTPTDGDAPRSPLESTLLDIWRGLLDAPGLGIHDDFFAAGGDSLLAARAATRMAEALDVRVSVGMVFETPTVAGLAGQLPASRAQALPGPAPAPASQPADEERILPATSAQQALWYVESLTGARSSYHVAQSFVLEGHVDETALAGALELVASRHDVLRARFVEHDSELRLAVGASPGAPLAVVPVTGDPVEAVMRFADTPFELDQAPLWRAGLLRATDGSERLVLVMHHIITDGWSLGVLVREIGLAYSALRSSRTPELPRLALDYAHYAHWQKEQAASEQATESIEYWRRRLAGLEPIDLPLDHPRPVRRSFAGAQVHTRIDAARLGGLDQLARRHRATLFMVLLAAWQAVLARHSGQDDIAVGTPVAGRWRPEFEPLVGYFVNMLVLRSDLSGNPTFGELLGRIRSGTLEAFDHQQLPFDRLVNELNPPREAGINPLFQVSFAMQNAASDRLELTGVRCRAEPLGARQAKFDLSLSITEREGELLATLEYAAELFDAPRIERIARHLLNVIDQVIADDGLRIAELELLDADERRQLRAWSQGPRNPYPANTPLAVLFEQQARRSPAAIALECVDARLSYAELNERANRLAHALRQRGIGPGSLVALAAARGQPLLVALLGIVMSGAAFLPLDTQYPAARLRLMIDDARPALALHDDSIDPAVIAAFGEAALPTLCLVRDAPALAAQPATDPEPLGGGDDLAYVMYTSGSTGRPKGVMVTQRAVARLVLNTDYVALGADDAVAQVSNVSFDAATFEIWGAWLNGARLVALPPDAILSTTRLGAAIREHSLTTMFLTTALFNAHAAEDPTIFAPLHTLMFGGEAADPASIGRVLASGAAPRRLVNGYGPTETTTFATSWQAPADPASHARETALGVPIGRPIANTSCHVLDSSGRPQPVGVLGELHIGGPGVARGYLGRDDLDAERFVPDPFEAEGGMLYRTGDLARWREDGVLLYEGRNDQQVKIRGFRIELGEIESALRDCTGVREAAILVDTHPRIGRRIVAFIVPARGFDPATLGTEIRGRLPEYMVPALLRELEALPVTANGKLDRAALVTCLHEERAVHVRANDPSTPGTIPRREDRDTRATDETVTRVLAIWRRILDRPDLDVDEHFFDAGGHSLLALRMLAEVEREFAVELRVAALFDAPTARLFAVLLRERRSAAGTGCAVTIQRGGAAAPLFFVSGYGGEIVMFRDLARALGPGQPLVVLDTAAFRAEELEGLTLPDVAARMIADLRAIQPRGPYHLCGYSLGGKFVYEIARQLRDSGEEVALLALLDCNVPGYPARRPWHRRLAVHAGRILAQGVAENARYLREQFGWLAQRFRGRDLFEHVPELADSQVAQSMSASAEAMFGIWRDHHPGRYEGTLLVVRAAIRSERASVVDDDPRLGWGAWVDGPVTVRHLAADHLSMLRPAHSRALAATLAEFLDGPAAAAAEAPAAAGARRRAASSDQAVA